MALTLSIAVAALRLLILLTTECNGEKFSCLGKPAGYYADIDSDCKKYFVCGGAGRISTAMCPNGTKFQQITLVCDHSNLVDCLKSTKYYAINALKASTDASKNALIVQQRNGKASVVGRIITLLDSRPLHFISDSSIDNKKNKTKTVDLDTTMMFRKKISRDCSTLCNPKPTSTFNLIPCYPCIHIK